MKSSTETIQQADLPGLALSENPKLNTQLSRVEVGIGVAILMVLLGFRRFYVNAQPWDSDEPQHLHVVWACANGMLPYKDVFDNHSPLFQAMSAPLFALLGERADIVTAMRWTMVPIVGLILATSYLIGAQLFSPRVGLWGAYWLTTATRQFMDQNYISLGSVLVLGKRIFPPPDGHIQFEVVIPEKYTLVGKSGPLSGTLDGANLNGPH